MRPAPVRARATGAPEGAGPQATSVAGLFAAALEHAVGAHGGPAFEAAAPHGVPSGDRGAPLGARIAAVLPPDRAAATAPPGEAADAAPPATTFDRVAAASTTEPHPHAAKASPRPHPGAGAGHLTVGRAGEEERALLAGAEGAGGGEGVEPAAIDREGEGAGGASSGGRSETQVDPRYSSLPTGEERAAPRASSGAPDDLAPRPASPLPVAPQSEGTDLLPRPPRASLRAATEYRNAQRRAASGSPGAGADPASALPASALAESRQPRSRGRRPTHGCLAPPGARARAPARGRVALARGGAGRGAAIRFAFPSRGRSRARPRRRARTDRQPPQGPRARRLAVAAHRSARRRPRARSVRGAPRGRLARAPGRRTPPRPAPAGDRCHGAGACALRPRARRWGSPQ